MKQSKKCNGWTFFIFAKSITDTGKFNFTIKASESMLWLIVLNVLSLASSGTNDIEDKKL